MSVPATRIPRITTGYCYDPRMLTHHPVEEDPNDKHPEQPDRILKIFEKIRDARLDQRMQEVKVREAVKAEVMLVHSEQHWERVRRGEFFPEIQILATKEYYNRLSLYLSRDSAMCARLSCGGVIETCRAVYEGRIRNAFAIVRPPGHHAEPEQEMGFCFFNNVAVTAKWLQTAYASRGLNKILILDWDVHHGNGTQKAFWSDPDVLYISIHQFQGGAFYPGGPFGGADQCGDGEGLGTSVNIPWSHEGMGDADYIYAFQRIVMPIANEFNPDFVIVSAGYDAAEGDALGGCHVTPAGFAHMTHMLSSLCDGKLVLALEGGYDVEAISTSAVECVKVLLGDLPPQLPNLKASPEASATMHEVALEQSRYWKSIRPDLNEPEGALRKQAAQEPVAQLLKAHRAWHLYSTHNLVNVELENPLLQDAYEDHVFCSENVFSADTLVVYMHDNGVIQPQLDSRTCDVNAEKDFIIQATDEVLNWVQLHGFGLIDANVMSRPPLKPTTRIAEERQEAMLASHIYCSLVSKCRAKKIVFIGVATACRALTEVINSHYEALRPKLKAAVMVLGLQKPPALLDPTLQPGLRSWYSAISRVTLPITFDLLQDAVVNTKPFGSLVDTDEPQALRCLHKTWADNASFISSRLAQPASNGV